jgi:RNA polymerase sigma factor (sigma-70 family)
MHPPISPDQVRKLVQALRQRGRTREDAEDLVQESFLRMELYEGDVRDVGAFVYTTARFLATNVYRRSLLTRISEKPVEEFTALADPGPTPERALLAAEALKQVQHTLDRSSIKTRNVFFAHRAGFDYREISAGLGVSVRAVEKHIKRAKALLKMCNQGACT